MTFNLINQYYYSTVCGTENLKNITSMPYNELAHKCYIGGKAFGVVLEVVRNDRGTFLEAQMTKVGMINNASTTYFV